MKDWFKNLLSLEERKSSTIMISFLGFVIISIWILFKTHDIPMSLVYLNLGLGGYIAGYNVIPQIFNNNYNSPYNSSYSSSLYSNYNNYTNGSITNTNPISTNIQTNKDTNGFV